MIGLLLCRLRLHRRKVASRHHWCGFDGMGDVESQLLLCRRPACGWKRRRELVHRPITKA